MTDIFPSDKSKTNNVEEISVDTFITVAYGLASKKACNRQQINTSSQSIQDPERFLAPI